MSHDHTDFTLLKAALDLTSSLDLTAGLQNFVNQACALTSSPHAGGDHAPARAPRFASGARGARGSYDGDPGGQPPPRQLPRGCAGP